MHDLVYGDVDRDVCGIIDLCCSVCDDRNDTYELMLRSLCCYGWIGDGHFSFSSELRAEFFAIQTAMRNKKMLESLMTFNDGTNWAGSYRAVVAMRDKYISFLMKLDEEIAVMCRSLKSTTIVELKSRNGSREKWIRLAFHDKKPVNVGDEACNATEKPPLRRRDQINQQMKKKIARVHKRNITVNQEESSDAKQAIRPDCKKAKGCDMVLG